MNMNYHDCGGCDGRGHHPTRTDLLCQMCDGTGKGPYLVAEWIDILPAIPLARGVPVRERLPDGRWVGFANATDDQTVLTILGLRRCSDLGPLRVDLDDPQGFAYAVRQLHRERPVAISSIEFDSYLDGVAKARGYNSGDWLLLSILCGQEEPTDADKLALAKALAKVMS